VKPATADPLSAIKAYSDNPSAFLALNSRTRHFAAPDVEGTIAYRERGRVLVQFGGPFAPPEQAELLLRRFLDAAAERRRRVIAVQLQRADAELYARNGFTVNQLGASYAVDLSRFTLRGSAFVKLRNKVSRALRGGLVIEEVDADARRDDLVSIDREWLRGKGRHVKELQFLIGELSGEYQPHRRLFLGSIDGTPVGYVSYAPVYGSRPGWLHDLSRRRSHEPPGVMEAINKAAVDTYRAEGAGWLHFGFTPFTGLAAEYEVSTASRSVARIVRGLATHGRLVYPAASQLAYKEKWAPHAVLPEYVAFHGRPRLGTIWQLLRVSNAI
jgi:lysylphosphatidylglycerol synthetase-like protein (DUF2156 family)